MRPILYSRSAEFIATWEDVIARLGGVFQTEGDVLVFGASGSGAMDSAVANLARPGQRVLVASCGNFGNRWASICADYGVDALHIEGEWGRPIDPAAVAEALAGEPGIEVVFVTQSETSTGVVSDLPALREAAGDRILVADAVSGLGVVDLPMDRWGIDVVVSGSQKGLMTPPGLAFVAANARAIERSAALGPGGFYLDWERTRKGGSRSPFTPAGDPGPPAPGRPRADGDRGPAGRVRPPPGARADVPRRGAGVRPVAARPGEPGGQRGHGLPASPRAWTARPSPGS